MTRNQLINSIFNKRTFLCVGLDPDIKKFPSCIEKNENSVFLFNKAIIDATAKHCVAFKPNVAFYECLGVSGWKALENTIKYIKTNYPEHLVIADAKRADIGNTAKKYAETFFEHLQADAITLSPYMGKDSIEPFLCFKDKWSIILAVTSNQGATDFQLAKLNNGREVFEKVIETSKNWGSPDNIMYVAGATQGALLRKVRELAPNNFLLVPGIGAQGGDLNEVVRKAMTKECGLLINSSRSILYASSGKDFAEAAAEAALNIAAEMGRYLDNISKNA